MKIIGDDENFDNSLDCLAKSSYEDIESLGIKLQKLSNNFTIWSFNAQSIYSKINLFKAAIYSLLAKKVVISCICIQDCYFGNKFPVDITDLDLPGYNLVTQHSKLIGESGKFCKNGGLCIWVHESYSFKKREPLCYQGKDWEALFIDITANFMKKPVTVGNIYRPPRNSKPLLGKFQSELNAIIKKMGTPAKYQILAGDFNFNLVNINQGTMVPNFFENLSDQLFSPHITLPTRKDKGSCTLLDHIWLRTPPSTFVPPSAIGSFILTDKISDHMAGICSFNIQNPKFEIPKYIEKRELTDLNIQRFATDFGRQNVALEIGPELEKKANDTYEIFYTKFSQTRDKIMPKIKKKFNRKKHNIQSWITPGILTSINKKNKLYVQMNKFSLGSVKREQIKTKFEEYNGILSKLIRQQKKMFFHNKFKQQASSIKGTWQAIKDILNKNRKTNDLATKFIVNGEEVTDPKRIADGLNEFFTTVGPDLAKSINTEGHPDVLSYMGNEHEQRFYFEYTDTEKLTKIIKGFQSKSSCGDDEISSIFLKNEHVLQALLPCLTILINQSLCTGIFPTRLKLAKVIALFKNKGDDFNFEYYRPISLLSILSKVYERVVFDQIYYYFQLHQLFYTNQYGFRKKHSTETAGLELIDRALKDVDNKQDPFAIFLDLSKAFDTIDHSIMIKKLKHYGIRGTALLWFESYLADRVQYVLYNGTKSRPMKIITGVPQGSILGPLLFLIYINDIKSSTDSFDVIGYADDTTLYGKLKHFASKTKRGECLVKTVNDEIDKVNIWLKVNKLSLNPSKTRLLIFRYHQRKNPETNTSKFQNTRDKFSIDGVPIKIVPSFNFLGVEIHQHLKWDDHIKNISSKLGKGVGILTKLKYFLPRPVLKMIYNTLIQSHLNYGILMWGLSPQISRLEVQQKKAIRAINLAKYNSHTSQLFKNLKILKLKDTFKLCCLKFYYNIQKNSIPFYFSTDFANQTLNTRTQGASQCLRAHLNREIIPNTPQCIIEKIQTHSFDGFSNYAKQHILSQYKSCEIGPTQCFPCRQTRP